MTTPPPVLLTGAAGTIGRFVLEELCAQGHPVVAIDLKQGPDRRGVRWFQCDIRDVQSLERIAATNGVRRFIHAPGRPGVRGNSLAACSCSLRCRTQIGGQMRSPTKGEPGV